MENPGNSPVGDSSLAYQDLSPDDILSSVESLGFRTDGFYGTGVAAPPDTP